MLIGACNPYAMNRCMPPQARFVYCESLTGASYAVRDHFGLANFDRHYFKNISHTFSSYATPHAPHAMLYALLGALLIDIGVLLAI